MNGVKSVEVNLTSGIAVVTGCVDKAEIRKAIQDIGFEVVDDSL
jgi:copper chaperone CopZ